MRLSKPIAASVFVMTVMLSSPRSAHADEAVAGEYFRSAAASYARNDFRTAATLFERAYKEAPRGAAIFNAGLAWESAGEPARAADAFTTALSAPDLESGQATTIRQRLKGLKRRLGVADVRGAGARVSVAHVSHATTPASIHLAPGKYDLSITLPNGTTQQRSITVTAGDTTVVALDAAPAAPPVAAQPSPAPPPVEQSEPTGSWLTTRKTVGFVMMGGGVIAAGAAVLLGMSALSSRDDYDASGHHDQNARDSAASLRTWTNVAWIGAGVLGAAGVVLIVTDSSNKTTASAGVGPRGAFVSIRY